MLAGLVQAEYVLRRIGRPLDAQACADAHELLTIAAPPKP